MVNSVDFAVYLRHRALERGLDPNVTQIQKWLYVCYGFYLAAYEKRLFNEKPKAWQYGPVFVDVYEKQKSSNNLEGLPLEDFSELEHIVDETLDNFGDWKASELVLWTHMLGGAWEKQWSKKMLGTMDDKAIRSDFERILVDEQEED